jgi:protein-disulfide isomerase
MRKIALYAAVATASLALSGCGSGNKDKTPAPTATSTKAPLSPADIAAYEKKINEAETPQLAMRLALEAPTEELSTKARAKGQELMKAATAKK